MSSTYPGNVPKTPYGVPNALNKTRVSWTHLALFEHILNNYYVEKGFEYVQEVFRKSC